MDIVVSDPKSDHHNVVVGLVDPTSFFFLEGNRVGASFGWADSFLVSVKYMSSTFFMLAHPDMSLS